MIPGLVLVSAFLHAGWNALLRLEDDKDRALVAAIVVASLLAVGVAGARWATGEVPFANAAGVGFTLLAGVFEAVYFATLARAMTLGRLGTVYTVSRGGAVLVVWPLSIALFAEAATSSSIGGSAIVLGGLVLCGAGAPTQGGSQPRKAIAWAIACACAIAGYHLAYKAALREGANPSACFAVSLSLSAAINLVRTRARIGERLRTRLPRTLVMGVVCSGSFLILMEALARGGSGFVLTLRNTSVLFATIMGAAIGERPRRAELLGATAVAAGAVLMSLGS